MDPLTRRRGGSIRNLLIIPIVVQIVVWVALVGFLSVRAGQASVETLLDRLGTEMAREVQVQLDSYMGIPLLINEINHNNIVSGLVDIEEASSRNRYFAGQLLAFPRASYSFVGFEDRSFYGARRNEAGGVELIKNDTETGGASWYFAMDEHRDATDLVVKIPNFDCRTRPWYIAAKEMGQALYSPVYRHFVYLDLAVTAAKPLYDDEGVFQGVLGVDFRLDSINDFLADIKTSTLATIVVVERGTGLMVGNSRRETNHVTDVEGAMVRRSPADLDNREFSETYQAFRASLGDTPLPTAESRALPGPEGRVFFYARPFLLANLDWEVIIALPEREFMTDISRNARVMVYIILGALVLSMVLAVLVAWRVFLPLSKLVHAASTLEGGNLEYRAVVEGRDEVATLAEAFNAMAEKLAGSFRTMEETIAARTEELRQSNAALSAANDTKDRFFSILAHDLRGPVGTLSILLADLARNPGAFAPEIRPELFREMAHSAGTVHALLENLLTWSRSQRGELRPVPVVFSVGEALEETVELLRESAGRKSLVLDLELCPCDVVADRDMVKAVHRNLLANAIKFSPEGSMVETGVTVGPALVEVWVRDQGVGMDQATLDRLFDPARVRSQDGTGGEKGNGLGLLICQDFVRLNGGTLVAESLPGQGTTMRFTLPRP